MLIDSLNKKFPDLENLRVRDVRVDKNARRVVCALSYPDLPSLNSQIRSQLREAVALEMPRGYRCDVTFSNDKFTAQSLVASVQDYLKRVFPLFANIKSDKIVAKVQDLSAEVVFSVDQFTKRNMELADFFTEISTYYASYSCYKIQFSAVVDRTVVVTDKEMADQEKMVRLSINKELLKPQRHFDVTDVEKQIGKEINVKPMYISDIRAPMDSCVICGKISSKEIRAVKNNAILKLCKFDLSDDSGGTMPCLMFVRFQIEDAETIKETTGKTDSEVKTISEKQRAANDKKMKKLAFLCDGTEVVVRGKVVFSQFSQRLELQMYDICRCKIQPLELQPKFERDVPDEYHLVFPTPLKEFRQLTLDNQEPKKSILDDTNCVVLFANETGSNITKDKIFAICGVRLINGHKREKIFTEVLPEMDLPQYIVDKTGVDLKKINLSPTITELIGDLYKFISDSVLIGDNLPWLMQFLNYYAAPLGFNFKNKTVTTSYAFERLFAAGTLKAKPIFSQWNEVAKALKIPFDGSENCQNKADFVSSCISALVDLA